MVDVMGVDHTPMACAICGFALDFDAFYGKSVHTIASQQTDHEPLPVPATDLPEMNAFCDFCGKRVLQADIWTVPCESFEHPMQIPGDRLRMSVGDWACCPVCAKLVTEDRWTHLVERVIVCHHAPAGIRPFIEALYEGIRQHQQGAPHLEKVT